MSNRAEMRGGVLIIGSLLWDDSGGRQRWRKTSLDMTDAVRVTASIGYGRRSESRGDTFTMTWDADQLLGTGIFVPLREPALTADRLVEAARAIWAAESMPATNDRISASWGSVGAIFRSSPDLDDLREEWAREFRRGGTVVPPVGELGALEVPWPALASRRLRLQQ